MNTTKIVKKEKKKIYQTHKVNTFYTENIKQTYISKPSILTKNTAKDK